jgi:hypothetical protein
MYVGMHGCAHELAALKHHATRYSFSTDYYLAIAALLFSLAQW